MTNNKNYPVIFFKNFLKEALEGADFSFYIAPY